MNLLTKLLISLFSGSGISLVHTWTCRLYSWVSYYKMKWWLYQVIKIENIL